MSSEVSLKKGFLEAGKFMSAFAMLWEIYGHYKSLLAFNGIINKHC